VVVSDPLASNDYFIALHRGCEINERRSVEKSVIVEWTLSGAFLLEELLL
jgi:hypothetical protein